MPDMPPLVADRPLVQSTLLLEKEIVALRDEGMLTYADTLSILPKRHEDRRQLPQFPHNPSSTAVGLRGRVQEVRKRFFSGSQASVEAVVSDESGGVFGSGAVLCRWYQMPYLAQVLAAGQQLSLFGKIREVKGQLLMEHPDFEILQDEAADSLHLNRIVPIYRKIGAFSPRRQREFFHHLLKRLDPASLPRCFPHLPESERLHTLQQLHFPAEMNDTIHARRLLALEEFAALQLNALWRRSEQRSLPGRVLGKKTTLLSAFYHSLPFDLTAAQKRVIKEIAADMRQAVPMNRLLQGDVGSGKTFVALAAMLLAVDSGCQAALMAPTQLLAEQHFATFARWLAPLDVAISLHCAQEQRHSHPQRPSAMVIGTHALLHDPNRFTDLGLVVIDEQHKFGVAQRAQLIAQGQQPDVLVMTATPIPRTLTQTLYGDMDLSVLDERPAQRGKIITAWRDSAKVSDLSAFLKQHLSEGRQAYLVFPLVEDTETLDLESASAAFTSWQKRLKPYRIGLLHGKMRSEEKQAIMDAFRQAELQVLISTTVVEVGVDVPNATIMIIHHAERYGLAQLHQLRGRIGRGEHKSYCVLLTNKATPEIAEKMQVLVNSNDGFVIAEADLQLRGPGALLGAAQSGRHATRFAELMTDLALQQQARALAQRVLSEDPHLDGKHAHCQHWLNVSAPAWQST